MQTELLHRYHSAAVVDKAKAATGKASRFPIIRLSLMLTHEEPDAEENVKMASRYCPNYIIISTELSRIEKFVTGFQNDLSRRDSFYALIFPHDHSFSAYTFLQIYPSAVYWNTDSHLTCGEQMRISWSFSNYEFDLYDIQMRNYKSHIEFGY